MPNFLMFSRLAIMLMPYLVLYRLSKWFSLTQGKLSQQKQYLTLAFTIFSQFLIRHTTQDFDLRLSSPRQPGHGFLSLVYARQRRQFIPQGAISFVEIAVDFVDFFDVMSRSCRSYVSTSLLKPNVTLSVSFARPPRANCKLQALVGRSIISFTHAIHQYCPDSMFPPARSACRSQDFRRSVGVPSLLEQHNRSPSDRRPGWLDLGSFRLQ